MPIVVQPRECVMRPDRALRPGVLSVCAAALGVLPLVPLPAQDSVPAFVVEHYDRHDLDGADA